jgi:hypothetical protein
MHAFRPTLNGRLLYGLAWSGIWVGGGMIILDLTTDAERGIWTGENQTWFSLGSNLGAELGGNYPIGWVAASIISLGGIVTFFWNSLIKIGMTGGFQPSGLALPGAAPPRILAPHRHGREEVGLSEHWVSRRRTARLVWQLSHHLGNPLMR